VFLRQLAGPDSACDMTIARVQQYQAAGADGAFVPGLIRLDEVQRVASAIELPLNLMALPGMPPVADLHAAGARRFTVGPALFQSAYGHALKLSQRLLREQDVAALFEAGIPYEVLNAEF
jgi:2-methylisocitrate lyase-like PEP mutase family enzyme